MIKRIFLNNWLILIAAIVAWFPIWGVSFVNDDFQILNYHQGGGFLSLFTPFWHSDISVYYWRPLGNLLHPLVLIFFGFSPLPFRILSVLLYAGCCVILSRFMETSGVKKEYAILGGVLFALLPSHEYQVAWIADQGESLVTILLLLTFIFYQRQRFLSLLCFTGALLTKESAFTGIFIPLLFLVLPGSIVKKNFCIRDCIIAFFVLLATQIYRYMVPGGSPFNSSNFEATGPLIWIINLLLYIPLSFVPPELLDLMSGSILISILSALLLVVVLYSIYRLFVKIPSDKKRVFITGLLWFLIFILPALPKLMRWYVFTASAGLMLSFSVLAEFILTEKSVTKPESYSKAILLLVIFFALFFSIVADITSMYNWKISGEKMKLITASLEGKNADTLALYCVPEKIKNVPLMKLGILETVEYGTGKKMNVYAPLRCELFSDKSSILLQKQNDSSYLFTLIYGRFKSRESKASSYIKEEKFSFSEDGYIIDIKNGINRTAVSEARVHMTPSRRKHSSLYYDGRNFKSF